MDSGDSQEPIQTAPQPQVAGTKKKGNTMKRIRATYLAGRREDMGKYYYGETWTNENGEHFRVKFGKVTRTDRPWTFEQIKARKEKNA